MSPGLDGLRATNKDIIILYIVAESAPQYIMVITEIIIDYPRRNH